MNSTNPLSPSQLAEGARLLEEYSRHVTPGTWELWHDWLLDHGDKLLSAAQCVAEVEGCVREAIAKLQWCAQLNADGLEINPGSPHYRSRKEAFDDAIEYVREIAADHNIDLSEPTPAGEPTKGTP